MALFEARDLCASYGDEPAGGTSDDARASDDVRKPGAIEDVSFSVDAGAICDVVGPSGSGKSTLFRVCARMMKRASGTLLLDGKPDSAFAAPEWRRSVCLVPQHVALVPGTVRDNLLLPWTLRVNAKGAPPSDDELERLLEAAQLETGLNRDASKLSGGQAARVALLRAFATHPKVLLLDEVDAALDDETSKAMSALTLREAQRGAACLRIRHRASDGLASETLRLAAGRLEKESRSEKEARA